MIQALRAVLRRHPRGLAAAGLGLLGLGAAALRRYCAGHGATLLVCRYISPTADDVFLTGDKPTEPVPSALPGASGTTVQPTGTAKSQPVELTGSVVARHHGGTGPPGAGHATSALPGIPAAPTAEVKTEHGDVQISGSNSGGLGSTLPSARIRVPSLNLTTIAPTSFPIHTERDTYDLPTWIQNTNLNCTEVEKVLNRDWLLAMPTIAMPPALKKVIEVLPDDVDAQQARVKLAQKQAPRNAQQVRVYHAQHEQGSSGSVEWPLWPELWQIQPSQQPDRDLEEVAKALAKMCVCAAWRSVRIHASADWAQWNVCELPVERVKNVWFCFNHPILGETLARMCNARKANATGSDLLPEAEAFWQLYREFCTWGNFSDPPDAATIVWASTPGRILDCKLLWSITCIWLQRHGAESWPDLTAFQEIQRTSLRLAGSTRTASAPPGAPSVR